MANMYWQKLIIINASIIVIILKLYNIFMIKIEKYVNDSSIFPSTDENGYPFFDQINCNLRNIYYISASIIFSHNLDFLYLDKLNKCKFIKRVQICKGNINCHNSLKESECSQNKNINFNISNYHNKENEFKGLIYWNAIKNLNNFGTEGKEIEMDFLHKILSGYESFIELIVNKNNTDKIKDKVTKSYEKMNNLFYLHSLLIKAFLKLNYTQFNYSLEESFDKNEKINDNFLQNYVDDCLLYSEDDLHLINNNNKIKLFEILNKIEDVLSCITSENIKYSSIIDIKSIKLMLRILLNYNDKYIDKNEKIIFTFFVNRFINSLRIIFESDFDLKYLSNKYLAIRDYAYILFIGLSITLLLLLNSFLIKNKERLEKKTTSRKRKKYEDLRQYKEDLQRIEWKKMQKEKENNKKENINNAYNESSMKI